MDKGLVWHFRLRGTRMTQFWIIWGSKKCRRENLFWLQCTAVKRYVLW